MEEWLWLIGLFFIFFEGNRFILLSWHMYEDFRAGFNIQHNLYQKKSNTTNIFLADLRSKNSEVEIVVDIKKWGNFEIFYN